MEDILCVSNTRVRVLCKSQRLQYGHYLHVIIHSEDIIWKSGAILRFICECQRPQSGYQGNSEESFWVRPREHIMWLSWQQCQRTQDIMWESNTIVRILCVRRHIEDFIQMFEVTQMTLYQCQRPDYVYWMSETSVNILNEWLWSQWSHWEHCISGKKVILYECQRLQWGDYVSLIGQSERLC